MVGWSEKWPVPSASEAKPQNDGLDIYQRGEFVTSYKEIMEACEYRFNRRRIIPTLKQILVVSVCQVKKELNVNVVKSVALENAHRVVEKNLDTVAQLQRINGYANELLDRLLISTPEEEEEEDSEYLECRSGELKTKGQKDDKSDLTIKDNYELALKAMTEIRSQLKLQIEILNSFYNITAMGEFQKEVLVAIGSVSGDLRDQIIQKLQEARALRSTVELV
jgi:hypothetical protein